MILVVVIVVVVVAVVVVNDAGDGVAAAGGFVDVLQQLVERGSCSAYVLLENYQITEARNL